jgi:sugar lactone lactonase YvrE
MSSPHRRVGALAAVLAATLTTTLTTTLGTSPVAAADHRSHAFPPRIELPDGFMPEGITIGRGATAWFGSRRDGDIYEVDLRTGEGETISEGPGTPSVGLKVDRRGRLFVSGGTGGDARVVDTRTGELLESYQFSTDADRFINDSLVTDDTVWFTDSRSARLFGLPVGRRGALPAPEDVVTVPLTGEWVQPPAGSNGANGLTETPNGEALLVVNAGVLYRVDPATGDARLVDTGGAALTNGDGMLLRGRSLYVVQNFLEQVSVLKVSRDGRSARLVHVIDEFEAEVDVPTTVAAFGRWLYLPNARFSTPAEPDTPYWVTRTSRVGHHRSR